MITLLLKASLVITVLLVFYKVFLEKESFFGSNRTYLLACMVLTFALPFITLPQMINEQGVFSSLIEKHIYKAENAASSEVLETKLSNKISKPNTATSDTQVLQESKKSRKASKEVTRTLDTSDSQVKEGKGLFYWLLMIYYFGVGIFTLNFIFQIVNVLLKIARSADRIVGVNDIIVNSPSMTEPCSFFNYIFINPESYDYDTYEQILAHEKIHVQKGHTYDLLLSEITVILLWFNPVMWFFRKEVEKNIEYQTDDILLKGETVEKENYQMNLLKVATYSMPLTITTNYNQSLIKQRIMKISAKKSNPHSLWKYAFTAPLIFSLLLLINKPMSAFTENADTNLETFDSDLENTNIASPLNETSESTEDENEKNESTKTVVKPDVAAFLAYYKSLSESDKARLLTELKGTSQEELNKAGAPASEPNNSFAQSETVNTVEDSSPKQPSSTFEKKSEVSLFENMSEDEKQVIFDILANMNVVDEQAAKDGHFDVKSKYKAIKETEGCEALLLAVRTENIDEVTRLLEKVDPNCIVKNPGNEVFTEGDRTWRILGAQTPLVAAGRVGNMKFVKLLVSKGADVNLRGHANETALMAAIKHGDFDMVKFLVMNGAKINTLVKHWGSALSAAAENGHLEIVQYLESKQSEIDSRVAHVGTSLMLAAKNGDLDIAKFLIGKGADVNKKEAHIGTPLILASKSGHLEMVKYLISKGADLDESVAHVGTPLISATESGNLEVAKYLIEKGADKNGEVAHVGTSLIKAAENGQLEMVKRIIEMGADVDKSVAHVGTPLIVAAEDGRLDVVKFLIEKGADVNKSVAHVGNPLICAARDGHLNVVKVLLKNGAGIDHGVAHVGTPLIDAAEDGQLEVVKYLIEQGADIDKEVAHVGTPLMCAVEDGQMDVVKYLIEKGADVNKWVQHVGSPLSQANDNGQIRIGEYLKSKGARQ